MPAAFYDRWELFMVHLTSLTDESLLRYYEGIRLQVSADLRSGFRLMGQAARERANVLLNEIQRRQLSVTPISWPDK
jgi:hypothetical protein